MIFKIRERRLKLPIFASRHILMGAILVLLLFASACSTQKNALPNRVYHSLNAKYNGYFNARESYRQGLRRLSDQHIDQYDQVLKIFRYGNEQQMAAVRGNMDVAYQKASTVIRKHSMNIRGVEYNPWIDQSFFLIARSHFFKRDFNLAVLTFQYIINQYDSEIKYESKAWLAKTYHEMGQYANALQMLERLEKNHSDGLLDSERSRLFRLVYADHFSRQEQYPQAIAQLNQAIELTRNRNERARLTFITAQMHQHSGDYGQAQQTYARVLRMNPGFELAFQSRIGMAMAYDPGEGGAGFIQNELMRMLRDDKNRDFRDEIYFALASLSLRQSKTEEAKEFLLMSARVSEKNRLQKGRSFLALGEIYFDIPDYLNAGNFYDSAMVYLPRGMENIDQIEQKRRVLSQLGAQLRIIQREDSLQRLAAMPEEARLRVVDGIIAAIAEQQQRERQIEQEMMRAAQAGHQMRMPGSGGMQDGGWYFYNPTAIAHGRTEFFGQFGNRQLEDMWRISNRTTMGFDLAMDDEDQEDETGGPLERNTYLRNIPTTPDQMEASSRRLSSAFYSLAMLLKDRLNDYDAAIENLETFLSRFPGHEQTLLAMYNLYAMHTELRNTARAEYYKNLLIRTFPASEFARILGDPDYLDRVRQRQNMATALYSQAFDAFHAGAFDRTLSLANQADTLEMPMQQQARFLYLRALAYNRLGDQRSYIRALETTASNFPETEVHPLALHLLASINEAQAAAYQDGFQSPVGEETHEPSVFAFQPSQVHFFVVAIRRNADANALRNAIVRLNEDSFSDSRLSANAVFFDDNWQFVTVTNFSNSRSGMEYYQAYVSADISGLFPVDATRAFIISVENYPVLYQEKNLEDYLRFFRNRYAVR